MVKVVTAPGRYCLVGNPVRFEISSDKQDPIAVVVQYGSQEVLLTAYPYRLGESYSATVDVSDVLRSFFDKELPLYGETVVIAPYEEFTVDCTVTIEKEIFNIAAIDGGVSDQAINNLDGYGLDMFNYRLDNPERSLLFTTRTNSPNLSLRESELFPFVFLHPGKHITFVSPLGNTLTQAALEKGTPCLMDLSSVRKMFMELHGELPAHLTIQVEGSNSSTVTITRSLWAEDTHWIIFKNSLGGYESVEITGKGYYTPEIGEANNYQQYTKHGTFKLKRGRVTMQDAITIEAGFKNQEELRFMMDLAATDRAYLIFPDGEIEECMPSIENPKIALRITTPTSLELKLEMTSKNNYYSPRIDLARPGAWILETGFWNDLAYWKDNTNWID